MTEESSYDMGSTIQAAEESILRISHELSRMKTAAQLLEESGKRSVRLQVSVEGLVVEIGSLVEVSSRIIDEMKELEANRLPAELRTVLVQCVEELKMEVTAEARGTTERVGTEVQSALIQRMEKLSTDLTSGTEWSKRDMMKRFDALEEQIGELRRMAEQSSRRRGLFG